MRQMAALAVTVTKSPCVGFDNILHKSGIVVVSGQTNLRQIVAKIFGGMLLVCLLLTTASAGPCPIATLDVYLKLEPCTVGPYTFSNFDLGTDSNIDPTTINVTPKAQDFTNTLTFTGFRRVAGTARLRLLYQVTTPGGKSIPVVSTEMRGISKPPGMATPWMVTAETAYSKTIDGDIDYVTVSAINNVSSSKYSSNRFEVGATGTPALYVATKFTLTNRSLFTAGDVIFWNERAETRPPPR
jgi:hypothetical protein